MAIKAPSWPVLIFGFLGTIAAFVASTAYRLGAWRPVEATTGAFQSRAYLAKDHLGAYHHIATVISEIEAWAKANGMDCDETAGIYFDDPNHQAEDRLRSKGGCILSTEELSRLKQKLNDQNPTLLPTGYHLTELPSFSWAYIATFSGAPSLGPLKVYPRAQDHALKNQLQIMSPVLEIYKLKTQTEIETTYVFPLKEKSSL